MEKIDHELLSDLAQSNVTLKKLYDRHIKLEKEVERFHRYSSYSSSAALRQKQLKKEKLLGMDSMMSILKDYREEHPQ